MLSSIFSHARQHKKLLNNSGAWPSGGSGDLFRTPANVVWVVPGVAEIVGQRYQTWNAANTYIQTQTPSASNNWSIVAGGTNNENIVLYDYIYIVGICGSTRFTGEMTINGTNDTSVYNSEITQFANTDNTKKASFINCKISGTKAATSIDAAQLVFIGENTVFQGGDFSTATGLFFVFGGIVFGSVFPSAGHFWDMKVPGGVITFNGGDFHDCYLTSTPTYNQGNYTFNGGTWGKSHTIGSGNSMTFRNVSILSGATITVDTGSTLNTEAQSVKLVVNNTGGTYNNTGVL